MRRWLALTVILWSARASADAVFTSAPLAGALGGMVSAAPPPEPPATPPTTRTGLMTESNKKTIDFISAADPIPYGKFTGIKEVKGIGPVPSNGLTRNEIDAVMKASASKIRGCYQAQLDKSPDLGGKIVVQFKIDANGAVASASIKSTTMKSPPVESCVLGEIRKLKFPAKAVANVSYPFIFSNGR